MKATGLNKRVQDLAMQTLEEMGGLATVDEVAAHIKAQLEGGDLNRLLMDGIRNIVGQAFRQVGISGLPLAPAIDAKGTHMQLALLSESEFRYVIRNCLKGSRRYLQRAEQWAARCFQLHGVVIDLAEIEQEISEEGLIA